MTLLCSYVFLVYHKIVPIACHLLQMLLLLFFCFCEAGFHFVAVADLELTKTRLALNSTFLCFKSVEKVCPTTSGFVFNFYLFIVRDFLEGRLRAMPKHYCKFMTEKREYTAWKGSITSVCSFSTRV